MKATLPSYLSPPFLCSHPPTLRRREALKTFQKNSSILKAAAAAEPEVPVKLYKPLPDWQRQLMARRLEGSKKLLNWKYGSGALLPLAAQQAVEAGGGAAGQQQQFQHQLPWRQRTPAKLPIIDP